MRPLLAWLLLSLVASVAIAQEAGDRPDRQAMPDAAPAPLQPQQTGYAFEQPRIVAQQRLLGRAHGISLLVSACMDKREHIDAALAAYAPWRESQEAALGQAQAELARHYFGPRADEAHWPDLLRALNLKNELQPTPGSAELAAACATLPQALERPRYDFGRQMRLLGSLAEASAGIEAELRWRWCRERIDEASRLVLDARYGVWREINEPRRQQAEAKLQQDWPFDAPADSVADLREMLARDPLLRGDAAACDAFSERLRLPQTALRKAFVPKE